MYNRWDIWWSIFFSCLIPIKGFASTIAQCGEHINVGNSVLLSCNVTGNIQNGITWFRGNDPIIHCALDQTCTSVNPTSYRVWTDYQFHISNASEEDFRVNWSCFDGSTKPTTETSSPSTCSLNKKTPAITTAVCGTKSIVGQSKVLRCTASSTIRYGITWFRNGEKIVKCFLNGNCLSLQPAKYKVLTQSDPTAHQVIIRNVSADDLTQNWTCVDSNEMYTPLPKSSTCQLPYEPSLVDCGSETAIIGESHELSCKIIDSTNVNIYRNEQAILRCATMNYCNIAVKAGLYEYFLSSDNTEIELKILNVSRMDLDAKWACGSNSLHAQPRCMLKGSTSDKKDVERDGLNTTGIIVGCLCGVIFIILAIVFGCWLCQKRKGKTITSNEPQNSNPCYENSVNSDSRKLISKGENTYVDLPITTEKRSKGEKPNKQTNATQNSKTEHVKHGLEKNQHPVNAEELPITNEQKEEFISRENTYEDIQLTTEKPSKGEKPKKQANATQNSKTEHVKHGLEKNQPPVTAEELPATSEQKEECIRRENTYEDIRITNEKRLKGEKPKKQTNATENSKTEHVKHGLEKNQHPVTSEELPTINEQKESVL